jgi:hypothetical protein
MAYRGDTTDPLENMIGRRHGRRHGSNKMILRLALFFVLALIFQSVFSVFQRALSQAPTSASPLTTTAQPATTAPDTARINAGGTKMSAADLEQMLRSAPTSSQAPRDVRCLPLQNGWDYVCTYHADAPHPQTHLKIGVRVSANAIVQASAPQPLATPLVSP